MNVFLLKYERNAVRITSLLFFFLMSFHCFGQMVEIDADSIGRSLLFRSHLLMQPRQLTSELADSLAQNQIPLAITISDEESPEKLKARFPGLPENCIFVSDKKPEAVKKELPGSICISSNLIEKWGSGTQLTYLWLEALPDSMWNLRSLVRIWGREGRQPVFLSATGGNEMRIARLVKQLNKQQKIFGVVRDGNRLLSSVSWKDFPERNTSGYFSFPVDESKNTAFAPYKPGFRFSPDIIIPSPENVSNLKVFNVLPLDRDFGLTDVFSFSGEVKNTVRNNDDEITLYGIGFGHDSQKGKCAIFSGKAYLDGGLKSRMSLQPNFTVTAWINPTELGKNNCILGKGKNFVWKIHQGQLTFTVQGVRDYCSLKTLIPVNQWSFVCLIHSSAENLVRFYLNGVLTDEINLLTPYTASDYTVLIGSNLWEEFFKGYMSEIKIWERELNDDEILAEYNRDHFSGYRLLIILAAGVGVVVILGLFLWFWGARKRRNPVGAEPVKFEKPVDLKSSEISVNQVLCFGGLMIAGPDGLDVAKKMSPKIKHLFVLILLHSFGGKKGISSREMSDLLWPGMSTQNTKNIRGTNIQNLKAVLTPCAGIKLVFQDKLWFFEFSDDYFIDYAFVQNWLDEERYYDLEKLVTRLPILTSILKRGPLFQQLGESWLDSYINQMSTRIIEYGESLFSVLQEGTHDSLLLDISEVISVNDPLNEPALRKRISILTKQGKLGLAHTVFDNFGKLYYELYQEKYTGGFKSASDLSAQVS
jgi:hypothetical protein